MTCPVGTAGIRMRVSHSAATSVIELLLVLIPLLNIFLLIWQHFASEVVPNPIPSQVLNSVSLNLI